MHVCMYVYIYMYVCMCMYIHVYIHVCMYVYIHVYMIYEKIRMSSAIIIPLGYMALI